MKSTRVLLLCLACIPFTACSTKSFTPSDKHIQQSNEAVPPAGSIPPTSKLSVVLPPPKPAAKVETYSVVVTNTSAREVLFALTRDAKINIDIGPGIEGSVTLNAIDQTLPQILDRISKQVDMRYSMENGDLFVQADTPFLKTYKIDYVNMDRDVTGSVSNSTQISSGSSGPAGGGVGGSNSSQLSIKNSAKNHFWETLVKNITDILHETDKILPAGSSETVVQQSNTTNTTGTGAPMPANKKTVKGGIENSPNPATLEGEGNTIIRRSTFREAASVIPNPEAGIITVRATGKQHEKIQNFIYQVMRNARRQVLIEATIAEVRLSDSYQQGIDWSKFLATSTAKGFNLSQTGNGVTPVNAGIGTLILNYTNPASKFGSLAASVSLLDTFGNVKVLSSPKLSVLNNQTAMLRVVDNNVWFNVNSTTAACAPAPCTPIVTYTTTVNTVQVGFTMSVTPEISDNDSVLLNVRPSITRRLPDATDPTPNLAVKNLVPQLSTREMESVLRIENNQIAVLGGLMEDSTDKATQQVPLLGDIPILGNLFKNRNDTSSKTELVIFLRPIIIKDASIDGDYSAYRNSVPDANFLKTDERAKP